VEARLFALVWNEIINKFREEDIVSDREVELLDLPPELWNVRVIRWPCFLLCNELSLALGQAKEFPGPDRRLWSKVCKNEYRNCAVIEVYDSAKYMMLEIIKERTGEHGIVSHLFREFDESMKLEKFTVEYKMSELNNVHTKLVALLNLILEPKKDMTKSMHCRLYMLWFVISRLRKGAWNN
jgi:callose synthase